MFDPIYTAANVAAEWQLALGALPPAMKEAVDLFDEADHAQAPPVHFNLTGVTIANISAKIEAHAQALAVAAQHDDARKQARTALAHRAIQAAADAIPTVIASLTPDLDAAVAQYRAAVEVLPERFTADDLLGAPDIEAAHKTAVEAAQTIKAIDHFLGRTADLPGYSTTERHSVLRVIEAKDRKELKTLLDATTKKSSPAEQKIEPVYRTAVNLGLTFRMATQLEAEQLRREIDAMPAVRTTGQKFVTLR